MPEAVYTRKSFFFLVRLGIYEGLLCSIAPESQELLVGVVWTEDLDAGREMLTTEILFLLNGDITWPGIPYKYEYFASTSRAAGYMCHEPPNEL